MKAGCFLLIDYMFIWSLQKKSNSEIPKVSGEQYVVPRLNASAVVHEGIRKFAIRDVGE